VRKPLKNYRTFLNIFFLRTQKGTNNMMSEFDELYFTPVVYVGLILLCLMITFSFVHLFDETTLRSEKNAETQLRINTITGFVTQEINDSNQTQNAPTNEDLSALKASAFYTAIILGILTLVIVVAFTLIFPRIKKFT
jgi:hypothetical protein